MLRGLGEEELKIRYIIKVAAETLSTLSERFSLLSMARWVSSVLFRVNQKVETELVMTPATLNYTAYTSFRASVSRVSLQLGARV